MKNKIMSKVADVRDSIKANFADLAEIRDEMFDRHPFLLGHIEGCIIVYWTIVISCFIMKLFKRKLGWVKM